MDLTKVTLSSAIRLGTAFMIAAASILQPCGASAQKADRLPVKSLPTEPQKAPSNFEQKLWDWTISFHPSIDTPPPGISFFSSTPDKLFLGKNEAEPGGWKDFCRRYVSECNHPSSSVSVLVTLDEKTMAAIEDVNRQENKRIFPITDMDHWGVIDRWDLAEDGAGDCEDYALSKRHILIERGMPASAILPVVVRDKDGEGHAVLAVRTDKGDLILDNMTGEIYTWQGSYNAMQTKFIKILDPDDPTERNWRDLRLNQWFLLDRTPQAAQRPSFTRAPHAVSGFVPRNSITP